jgi:hypothetical protein
MWLYDFSIQGAERERGEREREREREREMAAAGGEGGGQTALLVISCIVKLETYVCRAPR